MPLVYRPNSADDQATPFDQVLHFHAGLPKTATSFLQSRYFPCHDQITYLGKNIPNVHFLAPEIEQFVVETLRLRALKCDVAVARRLFDEHIRPLMGQGRAVVLSMEDGTHGSPKRRRKKLENLRAVCGACRLILTLRNPLEFVPSMYLQTIKRMNVHTRCRFTKPWLPEFEAWLAERWSRQEKGELTHLEYGDFIADWQEVFGAETIGLLVFEQLKRQPQEFLDQLSSLLGVRSVDAEALAEGPTVNPSLTAEQIQRLRQIKTSPLASLRFRFSKRHGRIQMLGSFDGPSSRPSLTGEWRQRICEITQERNRQLAASRQLPLEQFGYPV